MRTANKLKYLAGCEAGAGNFINDKLPRRARPSCAARRPGHRRAQVRQADADTAAP